MRGMQLRQSQVKGDRPKCPSVCPLCRQSHRIHRHGYYSRYRSMNDTQRVKVPRFLCIGCGRTWSVLPDDMLPYRALSTGLVEKYFDARFSSGSDPPVTERERACLERAEKKFLQRNAPLAVALGQMLTSIEPSAKQLWQRMRRIGHLDKILQFLAEKFNTSLLGDYKCLEPCWQSCC